MKGFARLVAVLGAVGVAWVLFGEGPKDIVLVYDLPPGAGASALEVEVRRGGETVRRAEFRIPADPEGPRQVRHPVRLPEGDYRLVWRWERPGGASRGDRALAVREDGTIVLSLSP